MKTRLRLGEIQRIISNYNPLCLCLQHMGTSNLNIKNYQLASQSVGNNNELGTAIYVHNEVIFDKIDVTNSEFQYTATTLKPTNGTTFTILNVYNQPLFHYNFNNLKRIINSLPKPILLMGDLNAHNPMWDESCTNADEAGKKIEDMIDELNMICLNEESTPTYISYTNGASTSVDLTICSSNIEHAFDWNVLEDSYTSDHFPILITCLQPPQEPPHQRYNTEKANWTQYKSNIASNLQEYNENLNINETYEILQRCIINAADLSIPKTSSKKRKREVPWWNQELQQLLDQKHKLTSRLVHTKRKIDKLGNNNILDINTLNKIVNLTIEMCAIKPVLNKIRAKFKRTVLISKTESWKTYVSSLNSRTPIKKVWKKFNKISGKNNSNPRHAIVVNGTRLHEIPDICNAIGDQLQRTSSDANYDPEFLRHKLQEERNRIRFTPQREQIKTYNSIFTEAELVNALSNTTDSAPGKDKINFSMIKQLPPNGMTYLLNMFNDIWNNGVFPDEWRHAVIIPLAKPGKDPSNPSNYRPISLTACLCKCMEKMVNQRLTWILKEKGILTPTQFGAEKGRSTIEPLVLLEEHIRESFQRKIPTIAIFFDIEKAYDIQY